jgi:hypothetical protein
MLAMVAALLMVEAPVVEVKDAVSAALWQQQRANTLQLLAGAAKGTLALSST